MTDTTPSSNKLNFRQLLPIFFIVFIDVMGITLIIPVLPFYSLAFDASPEAIGFIFAAYPTMQFIFAPFLGSLSDRFGRKPVLALAQLGTFSSLLVLAFAGSLWMVIFARIIDGITGANISTVQSAISDSTSRENRAKGLGFVGAIFGIAFVLGPAISGIALSLTNNNYSAPVFVAAGFAALSVILTTFVFKETLPAEERKMSKIQGPNFRRLLGSFRDPRLGVLFLLVLLLQIVFGAFQATFAPFTLTRLGLNSTGNAIFFTIFGVILAVVQGGLIGPLSKRFGERRLIFAGLGLLSIGLFLASLTWEQAVPWYSRASLVEELTQVPGADTSNNAQLALLPPEAGRGYGALLFMVFGLLPMPIGFGILQPSVNSLITKRADPRKIGEALGFSAAFLGLGNALGPIIGGVLFDRISPWAPMGIGGIAGLFLLFLILRRLKPDVDDEDVGSYVVDEAQG